MLVEVVVHRGGGDVDVDAALADQLTAIRSTLDAFGVHFDNWRSERALVEAGKDEAAIGRLRAAGHVYEKDGAQWLRTTALGDISASSTARARSTYC